MPKRPKRGELTTQPAGDGPIRPRPPPRSSAVIGAAAGAKGGAMAPTPRTLSLSLALVGGCAGGDPAVADTDPDLGGSTSAGSSLPGDDGQPSPATSISAGDDGSSGTGEPASGSGLDSSSSGSGSDSDSDSDSSGSDSSTSGSDGSSSTGDGGLTAGDSTTGEALVTLDIDLLGAGVGGVRSEPKGILCGADCDEAFEVGTEVTLTALADNDSVFMGFSGACSGTDPCDLVLTEDTTVEATFEVYEPNLVFVTSVEVAPMHIGGLDGADQICADAATDAGLAGTYVAWLSTADVDARDRLEDARGWVRTDGGPFADTVDDLTSRIDFYPPRRDEYGNDVEGAPIVTGTSADGTGPFHSTFCADWTDDDGGLVGGGSADAGAGAWTQIWSYTCDTPRHLLCFGIDRDMPLQASPVAGRTAFVSTAEFAATDGRDAFDEACQDEADDAGLPGTFLAAVATSTDSIASRFDTDGMRWVRPDGVAVVPTADDLTTLEHLSAPILQTADGTRLWGERVWTGATSATALGAGEDACGDWADADIGSGWSALVTESAYWTTADGRRSCDTPLTHVYCFEE